MKQIIPRLPAFSVIAGSDQVGFHKPLDHPWIEIDVESQPSLSCDCYKRYGRGQTGKCYLKVEVPLRHCRFTTPEGIFEHRIGQCQRCLTIYWTDTP